MPLRIRDIARKRLLDGACLVAGRTGASNPVSWVTVMEILDAPDSLQKGELLVTTGYHLEDESRYGTLMDTLKRRDISGMAVQTGYYLNEIPPYLLRQADEQGVPLLRLPPELTFSAISRVLIDQIKLAETVPEEAGPELLGRQLGAAVRAEPALFSGEGRTLLVVALPAGDDAGGSEPACEAVGRVRAYLAAQSRVMRQILLEDGRAAFCLQLPPESSESEVMFELTIMLTFLSEQQHVNIFVGAQRLPAPDQLDAAFADALNCCDTLVRIGAKRGVCHADNLPFFELFNTIARNNRDSVMGKSSAMRTLLDYDRRHGTNYVHTLRVFLAHGGVQSPTAARLFIHRHTLTNRLSKIEQLCGWNLNEYYTRTYLSILLILHDYFAF